MKTVCRSLIAFLGVATITMTSLAKTPAGDGQPAQPGKSQQLASPDQVPEGLGKSDWHSIRAAYEAMKDADAAAHRLV